MRVRIHYTLTDGSTDSIVLEADTVDELRILAAYEVEKRSATNPWSELLD